MLAFLGDHPWLSVIILLILSNCVVESVKAWRGKSEDKDKDEA